MEKVAFDGIDDEPEAVGAADPVDEPLGLAVDDTLVELTVAEVEFTDMLDDAEVPVDVVGSADDEASVDAKVGWPKRADEPAPALELAEDDTTGVVEFAREAVATVALAELLNGAASRARRCAGSARAVDDRSARTRIEGDRAKTILWRRVGGRWMVDTGKKAEAELRLRDQHPTARAGMQLSLLE